MRAALQHHLTDHAGRTHEDYATSVAHWERLTDDPDVRSIDNLRMATFRKDFESQPLPSTGRCPSSRTVAKVLTELQAILASIGPPTNRLPHALGLIDRVPCCRKPSDESDSDALVVIASDDEVGRIYREAGNADWPHRGKVPAGVIWQALAVWLYNCGTRRNEFLHLHSHQVNLERGYFSQKPLKRGKLIPRPLAPVVIDHLRPLIASGSELVFPFPRSRKLIYATWYAIQRAAGIKVQRPLGSNRKPYYGFHELRKTCGTNLYRISPAAAQRMLGHSTVETTRRSYCAGDQLLLEATRVLSQPGEFVGQAETPTEPPPPRATFRIVG